MRSRAVTGVLTRGGDLKTLGQLTLGRSRSQGRADPGLAVTVVQAVISSSAAGKKPVSWRPPHARSRGSKATSSWPNGS